MLYLKLRREAVSDPTSSVDPCTKVVTSEEGRDIRGGQGRQRRAGTSEEGRDVRGGQGHQRRAVTGSVVRGKAE